MRTKDSRVVLRGLGRSNAPRLPGALARWKAYRALGKRVKMKDLKAEYNRIKKEQFPWAYEVTKCAPEQEFANLGQAFENYWRMKEEGTLPKLKHPRKDGEEGGFPHFKSKKRDRLSFYLANDKFSVSGYSLRVPKLGMVNMTEQLRFQGKILSAVISYRAGWWFVSISVEVQHEIPRHRGGTVGIDLQHHGVRVVLLIEEENRALRSHLRAGTIDVRRAGHAGANSDRAAVLQEYFAELP